MELENEISPIRTYPPIPSILSNSLMNLETFPVAIPHTTAFTTWS